ncbi:MAG: ThiF family adenylyltransferase [Anaeroplasmataceae bacterium]
MSDIYLRTRMLIGDEKQNKIINSRILVFGVGGVGSYVVEALARCGVGTIGIVDNDVITESNINRQLIALHSNIGQKKVDIVEARIKDINPSCKVIKYPFFYTTDTYGLINLDEYDFVVDAIDTITSKIYIAKYCYEHNIKLISSMGTGNRLDPSKFKIMNLNQTSYDPVAKVLRYELRKYNITNIKVLCSTEEPSKPLFDGDSNKRQTPASISFVPSSAGLLIASYVINEIIKD